MPPIVLDVFSMLLAVVGGLGLFLLGMKNMSEGIQAVAGDGLRRMIGMVTDNRIMATGVGCGVTCIVQSSSVTTVIVVGLVNAGFMALHQAIGVIMGANIGTTITGWILVLNIGKYGLPILGISAIVHLFAKRDRIRFIAMAVMGIGMVFFGLELMKNGFAPMKDMPQFKEAFLWFNASTYLGVMKCVMVGCLLTFIVQSSSATLGVTIGLATTGVIPFPTAAALVLGENIGTTITAWLASLGANTNAKRAAYAHVLFNVIGVAWITALFRWYAPLVAGIVEHFHGINPLTTTYADADGSLRYAMVITEAIALTHTGFNVANTILFLPFVRIYARLLERLIPARTVKETPHLIHLNSAGVDTPVIAIESSRREVLSMGRSVEKMLAWIAQVNYDGPFDDKLVEKIFHREEVLDNIEREVVVFLTQVLDGAVPRTVADEARQQFRIAHEMESASDAASAILKGYLKLRDQNLAYNESQLADMKQLHEMIAGYVRMIVDAYAEGQVEIVTKAHSQGSGITKRIKQFREAHMERVISDHIDPRVSLIYTTMLTNYRRIREHAVNMAESMAGSKAAVASAVPVTV